MELDKTLLLDSWKEIEAIEQETKLLLETVRGKSKTQKLHGKHFLSNYCTNTYYISFSCNRKRYSEEERDERQ